MEAVSSLRRLWGARKERLTGPEAALTLHGATAGGSVRKAGLGGGEIQLPLKTNAGCWPAVGERVEPQGGRYVKHWELVGDGSALSPAVRWSCGCTEAVPDLQLISGSKNRPTDHTAGCLFWVRRCSCSLCADFPPPFDCRAHGA